MLRAAAGLRWHRHDTACPRAPCPPAESLSYNPTVVEQLGVAGGASADDLKALCWRRVLKRVGIEPHMLGML